jgi:hypothetical protein
VRPAVNRPQRKGAHASGEISARELGALAFRAGGLRLPRFRIPLHFREDHERVGCLRDRFLQFFYSNLARFKRFKGLGFEAELWEDKQKEAADLIDRLKNVVAIYSREVVMAQVSRLSSPGR